MDKLIEKIRELDNPSVVGLDPTPEMMPPSLRREVYGTCGKTPDAVAEMFVRYNRAIVDATADIVPAVKLQIAMYERYGPAGLAAYVETAKHAAARGLYVIGDIKRGDIASTAEAYAAHLAGIDIDGKRFDPWGVDAATVNPYLGGDSVAPFLQACADFDKDIFVLIKTSNAGSEDIQDLRISPCREKHYNQATPETVYERIAELAKQWGEESIGKHGYSRVGGVVGATHRAAGERLRAMLPRVFFLVPGYGAQGASAEDIRGFFDREGGGAIVNSSRGIAGAYMKEKDFDESKGSCDASLSEVGAAARRAAINMRDELRKVTK